MPGRVVAAGVLRTTFDIHFYMNEVTGEVYYYDYKVKFGGGQRN